MFLNAHLASVFNFSGPKSSQKPKNLPALTLYGILIVVKFEVLLFLLSWQISSKTDAKWEKSIILYSKPHNFPKIIKRAIDCTNGDRVFVSRYWDHKKVWWESVYQSAVFFLVSMKIISCDEWIYCYVMLIL